MLEPHFFSARLAWSYHPGLSSKISQMLLLLAGGAEAHPTKILALNRHTQRTITHLPHILSEAATKPPQPARVSQETPLWPTWNQRRGQRPHSRFWPTHCLQPSLPEPRVFLWRHRATRIRVCL